MGAIHDIRFERLAREAADRPLRLCAEDQATLLRHLRVVGESFGLRAAPDVPLDVMTARALVRHLARLRTRLEPSSLGQHLALGRLDSVFRLVASAVRLAAHSPRRTG